MCVNMKRKGKESSTRLGIRRKESEWQRGKGNGEKMKKSIATLELRSHFTTRYLGGNLHA